MTQQKLASAAGVSLRSIQEWEAHGVEAASLRNVVKLADALGCSMEEFVERK